VAWFWGGPRPEPQTLARHDGYGTNPMAVAVERQPWLAYAAGSDGPDFAQFCRAHVIQSVDEFAGHPLDLEPWQADMIGEALAFDAEGRPIWRTALLVVPRKNGKTALLAAYALWRLLTDDGQPEIILAASSDEQASRLFDAIVSYLRRNDALRDMVVVRDYAGEILRADGGGLITRVSSDPKRLHGYNPSIVICDELGRSCGLPKGPPGRFEGARPGRPP
jgi:phage terminase large subunit-like protein